VRGAHGRRLQRLCSERVERRFAHVCDTGGACQTRLRRFVNVTKRYPVQMAAHNLAVVLRALFGVGKPRALQGEGGLGAAAFAVVVWLAASWRLPAAVRWVGRLTVHAVTLHRPRPRIA
jgi:transposase